MTTKKKQKITIICDIIAMICFGIVTYGHFYRGRILFGCIFALLTIAQLVFMVMNCRIFRKETRK